MNKETSTKYEKGPKNEGNLNPKSVNNIYRRTLKSFSLGNCRHIHGLSGQKMSCMYPRSRLRRHFFPFHRGNPKLPNHIRWMLCHIVIDVIQSKRFQLSHDGPLDIFLLVLPRTNLHRIISIGLIRSFDAQYDIGIEVEDSARMTNTPRIPYRHHTELQPDGATSFVSCRPSKGPCCLFFKVFETVRHDKGTLPLSGAWTPLSHHALSTEVVFIFWWKVCGIGGVLGDGGNNDGVSRWWDKDWVFLFAS